MRGDEPKKAELVSMSGTPLAVFTDPELCEAWRKWFRSNYLLNAPPNVDVKTVMVDPPVPDDCARCVHCNCRVAWHEEVQHPDLVLVEHRLPDDYAGPLKVGPDGIFKQHLHPRLIRCTKTACNCSVQELASEPQVAQRVAPWGEMFTRAPRR